MTDLLDTLRASLPRRYTVLGELARGGMAAVYLALEEHPSRRVAIKVFGPTVPSAQSRERFVREVEVSARLSHPNIVPIFAAGEAGELLYYVMPHLEGEALRQRLAREPKLTLEETVRLTREVADALAYAHSHGVIHRDIKPENILISDGHAVVADFGIARAVSAAGDEKLTAAGQPIGTPRYMSPEQAMGSEDLDARTDIYSLGCVLYELLVGEPPSAWPNERAVREGRMLDLPPAHRRALDAVPRELERVIATALARERADRFASAQQLAEALRGSSALPTTGTFATFRRRSKRFWAGVVAGAVTTLAVAGALAHLMRRHTGMDARRVVVATFENQTGDSRLDPVGRLAADWITQGLTQSGIVEVVTSAAASGAARVVRAATARLPGAEEIAAATGAGIVVSGAYYRHGDSLQFQARVIDALDGKVIQAVAPVSGLARSPMPAVEALRQRVMGVLAVGINPRLGYWAHTSIQPPLYSAYQEFIEGLEAYIGGNLALATVHFSRSAALDSTFATATLWNALTHTNLGDFPGADSLARRLEPVRDRLAPIDRLFLQWIEALIRGDLAAAYRAVAAAAKLAPTSEASVAAGQAALYLNRPRQALRYFDALDPSHGFLREWHWYWDGPTTAYHMLGDYRRELEAARLARRQFPDNPSSLVFEARALAALGREREVGDLLDRALAMPTHMGITPGDVMLVASHALRASGQAAAARAAADRAVSWYGIQLEREAQSEAARLGLARALYHAEQWEDARAVVGQLAAEHPDSVSYRGLLGTIAARTGRQEEALGIAAELDRRSGPYLYGLQKLWQARIAALLGDRDRAVALLTEAFAQGQPYWYMLLVDPDLEPLRDYAPFRELIRPKG